MPELPDLEVFSRNLSKKLAGKTLTKITVRNAKKLKAPARELEKTLEQQSLRRVYREGKELYFEFKKGDILSLHLMLKGRLYFFEGDNPHKYTIVELLFDDDTGLALTDFQGAAVPTLNPAPPEAPDALSKEADVPFLYDALSKSRSAVKSFLLDQHIIRGIGNAYADEILWEAGISPFSNCNKIPAAKVKALHKAIGEVLEDAQKKIGEADPDIISGEIRDFMKIHNAHKKESPTGAEIKQKPVGGRKTYYTDEQELYK
jgi:formamidopyrimidine-DNA glycosylase